MDKYQLTPEIMVAHIISVLGVPAKRSNTTEHLKCCLHDFDATFIESLWFKGDIQINIYQDLNIYKSLSVSVFIPNNTNNNSFRLTDIRLTEYSDFIKMIQNQHVQNRWAV